MTYATLTDMQNRFSQQELIDISDRDGTQGGIVSSVIEQALTDATNKINGYLSGRYSLPLNPVPEVLTRTCCDLARYDLYDTDPSDHIQKRQADAVRFLEKLAKGEVTLGLPNDDEATSNDLPQFQSAGTVFGRKQSQGFI